MADNTTTLPTTFNCDDFEIEVRANRDNYDREHHWELIADRLEAAARAARYEAKRRGSWS